MFDSLLKVALSPVDIALSATKDVVDVVTGESLEKDSLIENTENSMCRLGGNLEKTFDPHE